MGQLKLETAKLDLTDDELEFIHCLIDGQRHSTTGHFDYIFVFDILGKRYAVNTDGYQLRGVKVSSDDVEVGRYNWEDLLKTGQDGKLASIAKPTIDAVRNAVHAVSSVEKGETDEVGSYIWKMKDGNHLEPAEDLKHSDLRMFSGYFVDKDPYGDEMEISVASTKDILTPVVFRSNRAIAIVMPMFRQ